MNEVEEIKARLDIVDVLGQYVQLQRAGRSFKALCPFHQEKTPSFIVSPERQSWHCFGACGTGGDVFAFVMRKEGIEFPEALRTLAGKAGVTLKERRSPEETSRRERIFATNEAAARWYHDLLVNDETGKEAWDYVKSRGIDQPTAEAFLLGFSPASWEATREQMRERGYTDADLVAAGLLVEGDSGLHDRFRGRLMFAIRDARGRFAGFGARALDDSMPKYLNTPQTPVFDKGGMLYSLDRAQEGIRREGCAVIVEGYMDVIAAHQSGIDNVVATMGTSLTERQVRRLKRQTRNIVLALDADAAGSEAALRGHEVVEEAMRQGEDREAVPVVSWRGLVGYQDATSVDLKVAVLPEGRDPDDVIRGNPDTWRELISSARPVLDHRFDAATSRHDLSTPRGRSEAVQELLPLLEPVRDAVVRAHYLQWLSRMSFTKEEELSHMMSRPRRRRAEPQKATASLESTRGDPREEFLLTLLLRFPNLRDAGMAVAPELLWESANREVWTAWQRSDDLDSVKESIPDQLEAHLDRLLERRLTGVSDKNAEAALADCVRRLEERQLRTEKQAMTAMLAAREEEIGASTLLEATASGDDSDEEPAKEAAILHRKDMETGLKLHTRNRKGEVGGGSADRVTNG